MNNCPCCSRPLLRHIRHQEIYWFCRSCWQEMPVFNEQQYTLLPNGYIKEFPRKLEKREKSNLLCLNKAQSITGWIGVQTLPEIVKTPDFY
ncbi:hypothetical protein BZZ01_12015 [Nostocales cyanobacterium HT-58-2]|nr:hypothetical protein BZZ01_12015 [Nostocales cyanobacterium HT-58-2]